MTRQKSNMHFKKLRVKIEEGPVEEDDKNDDE